jgi:transcriptional regulator with XRE-family HTH domain
MISEFNATLILTYCRKNVLCPIVDIWRRIMKNKKHITIKDYLWESRLTLKQFAEKIGVPYTHISKLANKRHVPEYATARKIQDSTDHRVDARELMLACFEERIKNSERDWGS